MHQLSKCEEKVSMEMNVMGNFRRPVPAVEEEREQAEFEMDVKFLRERQRRMLDEDFIQ